MQKVFFSRTLPVDSPAQRLIDHGYQVSGESLLTLEYLEFALPSSFDWLFFYSQHGAHAFFNQIDVGLLANKKLAAFGPKTAAVVANQAICQFVGNGRGSDTAGAFDLVARSSTVVFARAKHSMRSVQRRLQLANVIDLVTYNNSINPEARPTDHDIAVITSPLNARAYVQNSGGELAKHMIAIGESTRSVLTKLGVGNILMPEKPSEESIVDLILQLKSS